MTEDKAIQMPETLLTKEKIWEILDPHNMTPSAVRATMPMIDELNLVETQNAETKRVIVEWIADRSFGFQCCPTNPMMLHTPYEDYRALRKWALGEEPKE